MAARFAEHLGCRALPFKHHRPLRFGTHPNPPLATPWRSSGTTESCHEIEVRVARLPGPSSDEPNRIRDTVVFGRSIIYQEFRDKPGDFADDHHGTEIDGVACLKRHARVGRRTPAAVGGAEVGRDGQMRVISLFSGAGGMDLGFVRAGHTVVWANDHDKDCVRTYRHNIGAHIVHGDIEDIPSASIPSGDVLIGGFPCQGFSRANLRRSPDDRRNRLYLEFVRILEEKQPTYFVAENVRGLLSLDGGRVIDMILSDFAAVGYSVSYSVVNMADFGVPQTRRRVIIIGNRKGVSAKKRVTLPESTHAPNAMLDREPWVTIGEALVDIPEPATDHGLLNHVYSKYKVTNRDFTGHRRTDPMKPSPTILARGNGKGGVCALQHPQNHRRLSVRESAIVQSFPVGFEFFGAMNSMYRQVGNAVPPRFSECLAHQFSVIEASGCE